MEHLLGWTLSTLVGAFVGSFLSGYLKTKGQNLATHEDLNKLVSQLEATTRATQAIESQFSGDLWNRQRHWELKRDAVLETMQALGRAHESLQMLGAVAAAQADCAATSELFLPQLKSWQQTRDAFDDKRFATGFLCSDEFDIALRTLNTHMHEAASVAVSGKPFSKSEVFFPIDRELRAVLVLARHELDLAKPLNAKEQSI